MIPKVELDEFERAFGRLVEAMERFRKEIRTEREVLFLQIGLRASHIEESLMLGDSERANAHFRAMIDLLARLE